MTDKSTIRLVTLFLGIVIIGGLASVVALTLFDKAIPDIVGNVTTTALGALSALLVSTRVDPGQLSSAEPSVADTPGVGVQRRRRGPLAESNPSMPSPLADTDEGEPTPVAPRRRAAAKP